MATQPGAEAPAGTYRVTICKSVVFLPAYKIGAVSLTVEARKTMSVRILALVFGLVTVLALASCKGGHFGQPPPTPERGPLAHPGQ